MHSKLQLLSYPTHLRVVVPSANLVPYDWGETGTMENVGVHFLFTHEGLTEEAGLLSDRSPQAFRTETGRWRTYRVCKGAIPLCTSNGLG